MDTLRIIEFVPPAVEALARDLSYFDEEGVAVETERTRSAPEQRDRLLAGEFGAGLTAIDNLIAWNADGADFVLVAQLERTTVLDLIARSGVRQIADLDGERIAVDSPVTGFSIVLRAVFARHGLHLADDQLVAAGAIPERHEAIRSGAASAALLAPPWSQQAVAAGLTHVTTVEAEYPAFPGIGLAVRRSALERLREPLSAYLRATGRAAAWATDPANRAAAAELLVAAGFPPAGAAAILDVVPPTIAPAMDGLRLLYELREELGRLPAGAPSPESLVDTSLLPAAA